jgi:pentatricopeptide repeat protein
MLDACGRAGRLDGVGEIFRRMPVECDQQALGAYCSHASASKANGVAGERFLWKRFLAGRDTYVSMSKSLADVGRWDDVCAVRERAAATRIDKTAACTWIQV